MRVLYAAGLFAIVAVIAAAFAYFSHAVDRDKIGDAATWVGAVFAGLAFGGSIWLAQSESRRQRSRDQAAGLIVAAEIADSVVRGHVLLESIEGTVRDHLERPDAQDGIVDIEYVRNQIASHAFVSRDDLEKCAALDPQMSLSIARVQGSLRACQEMLETFSMVPGGPMRVLVLQQLLARVKAVVDESNAATDRLIELLRDANLREEK